MVGLFDDAAGEHGGLYTGYFDDTEGSHGLRFRDGTETHSNQHCNCVASVAARTRRTRLGSGARGRADGGEPSSHGIPAYQLHVRDRCDT